MDPVPFSHGHAAGIRRRGWTMADLADMVGVARSTVSRWLKESRIPAPSTCQRLAVVLGVPLDVVLFHAGHQAHPGSPRAELESRLDALNHRYGVLMRELEELEQTIAATQHDLAMLEERESRLESPSQVALSAVRAVEMPYAVRNEVERRLTRALVEWEPQWLAQRDRPGHRAPEEDEANE